MAGIEKPKNILHTIKAYLYPNHLKNGGGKYIARAKAEMPLTVKDICASAATRGGSGMDCNTMQQAVNTFFAEAAYQLADGFSVENDYYSIHPKIGGTFESERSPKNSARNPVSYSFRRRKGFQNIIDVTTVKIEGLAPNEAYVSEILDVNTGLKDGTLSSGGQLVIYGHRIKIAGNNPACGLYLVSSAGVRTRVSGNFAVNARTKLIVQLPTLKKGAYHIELVTQDSNGKELKEPRTITFTEDCKVS